MHKTRRATLVALGGTVTLAGCTSSEGEGESQDSDGDGVPDEHDYAPDDPDVQSKSDLTGGSDGAESGSSSDAAGEGDADDGTATEAASGGSGGDTSDSGTDSSASSDSGSTGDITYPSHSGSHTITATDNYWAWEVTMPGRFVLEYTVTNLRDENYDFDVLLYDESRFREYRAIATEREDGIRPEYIDGSAPGVEAGASGRVELPEGTYYLVVDNTDLSDAGDWGTEDTRRVGVEIRTREA